MKAQQFFIIFHHEIKIIKHQHLMQCSHWPLKPYYNHFVNNLRRSWRLFPANEQFEYNIWTDLLNYILGIDSATRNKIKLTFEGLSSFTIIRCHEFQYNETLALQLVTANRLQMSLEGLVRKSCIWDHYISAMYTNSLTDNKKTNKKYRYLPGVNVMF